jgi:hypothetical protein
VQRKSSLQIKQVGVRAGAREEYLLLRELVDQ